VFAFAVVDDARVDAGDELFAGSGLRLAAALAS
jgi:hypothetical protein